MPWVTCPADAGHSWSCTQVSPGVQAGKQASEQAVTTWRGACNVIFKFFTGQGLVLGLQVVVPHEVGGRLLRRHLPVPLDPPLAQRPHQLHDPAVEQQALRQSHYLQLVLWRGLCSGNNTCDLVSSAEDGPPRPSVGPVLGQSQAQHLAAAVPVQSMRWRRKLTSSPPIWRVGSAAWAPARWTAGAAPRPA